MNPGVKMNTVELGRLRSAAGRAKVLYPGPVGEMLSKELASWEAVGMRLGGHNLIGRLVDKLLTMTLPDERKTPDEPRDSTAERAGGTTAPVQHP